MMEWAKSLVSTTPTFKEGDTVVLKYPGNPNNPRILYKILQIYNGYVSIESNKEICRLKEGSIRYPEPEELL